MAEYLKNMELNIKSGKNGFNIFFKSIIIVKDIPEELLAAYIGRRIGMVLSELSKEVKDFSEEIKKRNSQTFLNLFSKEDNEECQDNHAEKE